MPPVGIPCRHQDASYLETVVTYPLEPPDLTISGWSQSITASTAKPDLQDFSTLYQGHPGMPEMSLSAQGH